MQEKKKTTEKLPAIPMRGTVAFPHMMMHFDVARTMSVQAVESALRHDRRVFLTAQKDIFEEEPTAHDLYQVGVVAEIRQTLKSQDDTVRILVEGVCRAKVKSIRNENGVLMAEIRRLPDNSRETFDAVEMQALIRALKNVYDRYSSLFPRMPKEVLISVMCQDDPMSLYEEIVFNTMLDFKDKQLLLEEGHLFRRMQLLYEILTKEAMVLEAEKEIHDRTQENIDQGQREYFLREQLKVIADQLREETGEEPLDDADSYTERIYALNLPQESEAKLLKEARRLRQMPPASQEAYVISSLSRCLPGTSWRSANRGKYGFAVRTRKIRCRTLWPPESQRPHSGEPCRACPESGAERSDSVPCGSSRSGQILHWPLDCRGHLKKICQSIPRRYPR